MAGCTDRAFEFERQESPGQSSGSAAAALFAAAPALGKSERMLAEI